MCFHDSGTKVCICMVCMYVHIDPCVHVCMCALGGGAPAEYGGADDDAAVPRTEATCATYTLCDAKTDG